MPLRLAASEFQPVRAGLTQEVIDRVLMLLGDRLVLEEEAAAVQVQGNRRRQVIVVLFAVFEDLLIDAVDPVVEPGEGLHRRVDVDLHAQVAQTAEAGGDVQRDVIVGRTAGEPRPGPIGILHVRQLAADSASSRR